MADFIPLKEIVLKWKYWQRFFASSSSSEENNSGDVYLGSRSRFFYSYIINDGNGSMKSISDLSFVEFSRYNYILAIA